MIDINKYEETDHPELVEFEGETLGDTLTNLLAEVERLRKKLFEAELWVNNDSYTFENDMKELNDYAEAIE